MAGKDKPKKTEGSQCENGRLEFAPETITTAHPCMNCICKYDESADGGCNADDLDEFYPCNSAAAEKVEIANGIHQYAEHRHKKYQDECENQPNADSQQPLLPG